MPVYAFVNRAILENRLGEAANALERLVRFRPELVQPRVDLARIYDALGAPELGERHVAEAREAGLTEAQEAQLAALGAASSSDLTYSGFFAIGAGGDTNPAASPRDSVVDFTSPLTGLVEEFDLGVSEEASALVFAQAGFVAEAPLADTRLRVDFSAFGIRFQDDASQNDGVAALRGGPVIPIENGELRPFAEIGYRSFGGDPYALAAFGGVDGFRVLDGGVVLSYEVAAGYREFYETPIATSRDDLDGFEIRGAATFTAPIGPATTGDLIIGLSLVDAAEDYEDYYAVGIDGSVTHEFIFADLDLTASAGAGLAYSNYQAPDPSIVPEAREEIAVAAFVSLAAALDDVTTIDATVAVRRRYSTVDIYDNEGLRATIRVARSF